jgi:phosphatidylinositol alpha-1,6-mannosyltransferase
MRVSIASEQRFFRSIDGTVQTDSAVGSYEYWNRYRHVFDSVVVLARVADRPAPRAAPAEGPGIRVHPLPDYRGFGEYVGKRKALARAVAAACAASDALVARVPGAIGDLAIRDYIRTQRSFGIHVVGDPAEVFRRGVVDHPLRPVLRRRASRNLRRWCREAGSVAYVTRHYLQDRYPATSAFVTHFSDVDLPNDAFAAPRRPQSPPAPLRLISVAVLSQRYKGIDVLFEAIAALRQDVACSFELVGDGTLRRELEAKATELGIRDCVTFVGQLSDARAIRERLDHADLFVLPSLTEGLPRALLEAMARGLPCVASAVGGVTELLAASDLVSPARPQELARKIAEMGQNPELLAMASARNFQTASDYSTEATERRRAEFCRHIVASAIPGREPVWRS